MERKLGAVLAQLRRDAGLSQQALAGRMCMEGFSVTNQAISKLEHDLTQPSASQFLALCRILQVKDVLREFTGADASADPLNGLSRQGREKAEEYIRLLLLSGLYSAKPSAPPAQQQRSLPLYHISVSAGTGQFLDSSDYEMIQVSDDVPASANFGVHIAGDSMEPLFSDGQIVWVRQQPTIRSGEIGVFLYDGASYCKRFACSGNQIFLESLNPAYPPIQVKNSSLRVFGRVVSGGAV